MTRSEWLEVVAMIQERWPERAQYRSIAWAEAWWPDVESFDQQTVFAAIRAYAAEDAKGFPPDGGQIVQRCLQMTGGLPDFDDVWREVLEGMRTWGLRAKPEWSSEAVKTLVRSLGWRSLCVMDESQMPTVRAQARDMWTTIRRRETRTMLGIGPAAQRALPAGTPDNVVSLPDLRMDRLGDS